MEKEHFEILMEAMESKFNFVLEGYSALGGKIEQVREESNQKHDHTAFMIDTLKQRIDSVEANLSSRIDHVESSLSKRIDGVESSLSKKIDAVAADLSAHRADTEAHKGLYRVKEG